ncbi:hypothetical protein [Microbacterium karelineae]|uniref:hypothetical protein n=1 Tax=Microbacterium karelineae TaxID=2654283 RepID=UPI0012EAE82E|nr:hypothetical protein [Microbacterium karelineae]
MTHVDGGDAVAVVAGLWIAVVCLMDPRSSIWRFGSRVSISNRWSFGIRKEIAVAAAWALKVQCSVIYGHAAVSKIFNEQWLDGTAIYYVVRMEMFGVNGMVGPLVRGLTTVPWIEFALTLGTLAIELFICVGIWGTFRIRRIVVAVSMLLHGAIFVLLGVASFSIIMIGLVLAAASGASTFSRDKGCRSDAFEIEARSVGAIMRR